MWHGKNSESHFGENEECKDFGDETQIETLQPDQTFV